MAFPNWFIAMNNFRRLSCLGFRPAQCVLGVVLWHLMAAGSVLGANNVTSFSDLTLVETFHCVSVNVTYAGDDNTNSVVTVQYRIGAGSWKDGYDLWRDHFNLRHSGSLVNLTPNTAYDVRVTISDADGVPADPNLTNTVTTWSETFTIGSSDALANTTNAPLTITSGGSAGSYRAYGPASGRIWWVTDTNYPIGMIIDTDWVLIRNIDFRGSRTNLLRINDSQTNIVVDNCTFADWGWHGVAPGPGLGWPDEQNMSALLVGQSNPSQAEKVVVQNCIFGPANGGSNPWHSNTVNLGHPTGPHPLYFSATKGRMVARYNWIYGSEEHYFNDGIGGRQNEDATYGNVRQDSDIYGNWISHCWDDAIEMEGRNWNVRIWNNYVTNCFVAVATAAIRVGPVYAWRNTYVWSSQDSVITTNDPGYMFKCGHASTRAQFFFHNTTAWPGQGENGITTASGDRFHSHSRNNILYVSGVNAIETTGGDVTSSYNFDFFRPGSNKPANPAGQEANWVTNTPSFTTGPYGATAAPGWFLVVDSPGYHAGTSLKNFSDDASGNSLADPDMGAWDRRFPVMLLGPQTNAVEAAQPPLKMTLGGRVTISGRVTVGQ